MLVERATFTVALGRRVGQQNRVVTKRWSSGDGTLCKRCMPDSKEHDTVVVSFARVQSEPGEKNHADTKQQRVYRALLCSGQR